MKKFVFIVCTIIFATGCNSNEVKTDAAASDTTKVTSAPAEKLNYPYTLDQPYQDWQPGDQKHAVMVMKFLKAWETKNLAECGNYLGDSVDLRLDNYHKKLPHDSINAMLEWTWADMASVTIKMQDWESVISKDKKDEWVTLWYKQIMTNKKGKTDSLGIVDDAKIVNGKIVVFDEKVQHYPVVKK